ncbi:unnamed protein product [Cuscuta campestris]|uniref:Carboxypeptidase n=1 Tax=Cuscuta campestris TaxID=132261 RepID=A0A484LPF3_9ASTE|nr:unnamed protein product [Cuscuta campestris]
MWWPVVVALVLVCCPARQEAANGANTATSTAAMREAEKMIKGLNLSPSHKFNWGPSGTSLASRFDSNESTALVEKVFKIDSLADDPVIQSLGRHHVGYYKLPTAAQARMFYYFFESRTNQSQPLVIWLSGGPGCSSALALFYENGPFQIAKNMSLVWNYYGWDKVSNIIFIDQPTGTGFSYSSSKKDIRYDESGISNDLYAFLQEFLKAHPEFVKNEFYITGESYAGHYIPALASRIHQANKMKRGIRINLKGMAIGNGMTNPELQYAAYPDFALTQKLITQPLYHNLTLLVPSCQEAVRQCNKNMDGGKSCHSASNICQDQIYDLIEENMGNKNRYDVRKTCERGLLCYDFSSVETLLNDTSVKMALGVNEHIGFVSCSETVYDAMASDWFKDQSHAFPRLLEDGIKLLVYAGEYDLICNWLGNSRWVEALEWSGKRGFAGAANARFVVDGEVKGTLKSYGALTFLKVHGAGHLVPMDQPKASLEMLHRWMQSQL